MSTMSLMPPSGWSSPEKGDVRLHVGVFDYEDRIGVAVTTKRGHVHVKLDGYSLLEWPARFRDLADKLDELLIDAGELEYRSWLR